jgi:hypothetical protein
MSACDYYKKRIFFLLLKVNITRTAAAAHLAKRTDSTMTRFQFGEALRYAFERMLDRALPEPRDEQ